MAFTLPQSLDDWTYETVLTVVRTHHYEPGRFDFKLALNPTDPDAKKRDELLQSLRRTACAMANTDGGFILFGVRDREQKVATPEDRVVGIPQGDHRHTFGQKMSALEPHVRFDASPRLLKSDVDSDVGVWVVEVSKSETIHMVNPPGAFYRRDDGGHAVILNYYEVQNRLRAGLIREVRDEFRAVLVDVPRVRQFRLKLDELHETAKALQPLVNLFHDRFERLDTDGYDKLLADITVLITEPWVIDRLTSLSSAARRVNQALAHAATPTGNGLLLGLMREQELRVESDLRDIERYYLESAPVLDKQFPPSTRQ